MYVCTPSSFLKGKKKKKRRKYHISIVDTVSHRRQREMELRTPNPFGALERNKISENVCTSAARKHFPFPAQFFPVEKPDELRSARGELQESPPRFFLAKEFQLSRRSCSTRAEFIARLFKNARGRGISRAKKTRRNERMTHERWRRAS